MPNGNGSPRKLMFWGNRNGFFYVLDRGTGQISCRRPFVKVNWASGLDANGRANHHAPAGSGRPDFRAFKGEQTWYSPSYSPRTGLFYLSTWKITLRFFPA